MSLSWFVAGLIAAQSSAAPVGQEAANPRPAPTLNNVAQVKTNSPNKELDPKDPEYVRCKKETVIGSRAKRKTTCMTNREWARVERRGNEASREFAGDNFAAGEY